MRNYAALDKAWAQPAGGLRRHDVPANTVRLVASPAEPVQRSVVARAIDLLRQRGFTYIGLDAMDLPCYRSPSGALLVSVGSCRSLSYVSVRGRLQVVAAARTSTLACRISSSAADGRDAEGLAAVLD